MKGISLRQFKKESLPNPFCSYSSSYCSTPHSIILGISIADFTFSNQEFKGMLTIKHIKTGVKHILIGYINIRPQLLYTELLNNILESHAHTADQQEGFPLINDAKVLSALITLKATILQNSFLLPSHTHKPLKHPKHLFLQYQGILHQNSSLSERNGFLPPYILENSVENRTPIGLLQLTLSSSTYSSNFPHFSGSPPSLPPRYILRNTSMR